MAGRGEPQSTFTGRREPIIWAPSGQQNILAYMELAILVGIQGSGKSTFCSRTLQHTHLRLCRDVLITDNRLMVLFHAALAVSASVVIDNTNPSVRTRARFIRAAKAAGYSVVGYYFPTQVEVAIARNAARDCERRVPEKAILGTAAKLRPPTLDEGFDVLWRVEPMDDGFDILPLGE